MGQRRILVFGQSAAVVDEIVPELSRFLPALRIQRAQGAAAGEPEGECDEITASIICMRGAEEEAWGTSLLQHLHKRKAGFPIFAVTATEDPYLQLRLLELGASGCTATTSDLSRLVTLLLDALQQHDEDVAKTCHRADISCLAPPPTPCRFGLGEPPTPADTLPAESRPRGVRAKPK